MLPSIFILSFIIQCNCVFLYNFTDGKTCSIMCKIMYTHTGPDNVYIHVCIVLIMGSNSLGSSLGILFGGSEGGAR